MFKKSLLAIVAATALFGANVSMAYDPPVETNCNNDGNYIAYVIDGRNYCPISPPVITLPLPTLPVTLPVTTLQHQ